MAIEISDKDIQLIKNVLAYPSCDQLLLTDSQIKDIAVSHALQDYFTKFPLKQEKQYNMGGTSELILDFPDEFTYGVIDARVTDAGIVTGTGTSFYDLVLFQSMNGGSLMGGGNGAYGIKGYNPSSLIQTRDLQRMAYKSTQNTYMTVRYDVDVENRKVHTYSTVVGYLNVSWAKYSDNFNTVKYQRRFDVIKLAQAYLLEHFADTFSILTDSALDMSINIEALKTRAQQLKDGVKELWDSIPDILFLHSS
jgi:hypothetical protein